jgi:hypothetical protein
MSVALSRLVPTFDIEEVALARDVLYSGKIGSRPVETAWDDYAVLDEHRPELAHTIYIERGEKAVYGVVQFFGSLQFYCRLGDPMRQSRAAFLGTLDPLTGEERFAEVEPLNLAKQSSWRLTTDMPGLISHWEEKVWAGAIKRGAHRDSKKRELSDWNAPKQKLPPTWQSGTVDLLLRLKKTQKS